MKMKFGTMMTLKKRIKKNRMIMPMNNNLLLFGKISIKETTLRQYTDVNKTSCQPKDILTPFPLLIQVA